MYFDATVIHVQGLASYRTKFNPSLSKEMSVPSQKYDSCYPFV